MLQSDEAFVLTDNVKAVLEAVRISQPKDSVPMWPSNMVRRSIQADYIEWHIRISHLQWLKFAWGEATISS